MATTIRVYLDGGSTPAATGTMNPDRTFSVGVFSVPDGVHTFEITAQEDGKAESTRVIQTVTVTRNNIQLAGSISASAALAASALRLTAQPLAGSISAAITLAASGLRLTAMPLAGGVTGSAVLGNANLSVGAAGAVLSGSVSLSGVVTADLTVTAGGSSYTLPATDTLSRPSFNAGTTYAADAFVVITKYDAWQANVESPSYPGGVGGQWTKLTAYTDAQIGACAVWSGGTTYHVGNIVRHTTGGAASYRSLAAGNLGNFPQWSAASWAADATLGPAWKQVPGTSPFVVMASGGSAAIASGTVGSTYYDATAPARQASAQAHQADGAGPTVLQSDTDDTCYWATTSSYDDGEGGGWTYVQIYKVQAGVKGSPIAQVDVGVGTYVGYLRLEADNGTLRARTASDLSGPWTTIATAADSTLTSGRVGQRAEGISASIGAWRGEALA